MKSLSLFSGIGGLDLGLERAGFQIAAMCEADPYCRAILSERWPDVQISDDVRSIEPVSGEYECVFGGFPCQGISASGAGRGLADERSKLWFEMLRIIRGARPNWVIAENVPALRTRGADVVLGGLEAEGYTCWPLVVGAVHAGATHRRQRVFIVAALADSISSQLKGGSGSELQQEERPSKGSEFALAYAHNSGGREDREPPQLWAGGLEQPPGNGGPSESGQSEEGGRQSGASGARGQRIGSEENTAADCDGGRREIQRSGGLLDQERQAQWNDANGRHRWPSSPGQQQHPWEPPRVKSPLGGMPDGVSKRLVSRLRRERLKALGNAVVPQVAEAVGRAVMAVAREKKV